MAAEPMNKDNDVHATAAKRLPALLRASWDPEGRGLSATQAAAVQRVAENLGEGTDDGRSRGRA